MQRYLYILIFLANAGSALQAQNADRERFLNATVYRLTLEEKWDSVLYFCDRAEVENIVSYELSYSKGKALFATQKYRLALTEFIATAEMAEPGSDLKSYLYYSAKYSGMSNTARFWRFSMNGDERIKFGIGYFPVVEYVAAEYSNFISDNTEKNGAVQFFPPEPITFKSSYFKMTGNMQNTSASAGFGLCKRLGIYFSVNDLSTKDQYRLAYVDIPGAPLVYTNFAATTDQQSAYIATPILTGRKTTVVPAFHMISVRTTSFNQGPNAGEAIIADTSFAEHVASLTVSFEADRSARSFSASWSDLSQQDQIQFSFFNTWYPDYNLNQHYTLSLTGQSDGGFPGFAAGFSGGWKLTDFCWTEAGVRVGKLSDFNDFNGRIVHNNGDIRIASLEINPVFLITQHLSLSLLYSWSLNKLPYTLSDGSSGAGWRRISSSKINTQYNQHNLTGGLIWKL
ncbi:MAG: hypothetical protein A2W93_15560 [Bacteroidetes bacterium GWF2_43_63]|nr:MAG: hypothetical protein A2W94_05330 [Bacteroidetes bacterium GWE2_42_42]OFY53436.1 MAG: hypothetical protein A2W93_15560 [Bacteroidetes bacterium GWF2_43_63]HBG69390.1 hypothetical protein [Bacteroidales bacterium]HCB62009.1 hypothetical protein [Bacteroidales bacterium]HCY23155.1 hypothetical protein [Bacteroidales bacterium]